MEKEKPKKQIYIYTFVTMIKCKKLTKWNLWRLRKLMNQHNRRRKNGIEKKIPFNCDRINVGVAKAN